MSITTSYVDGQVLKAENVTEIVTKINANETNINGLSTTKVDKVTGKSLVSDTTITDLTDTTDTSLHYHSSDRNRSNHTGTQSASTITQDSSNRFVSDTEKSTWNGKATQSNIDNSINNIQIGGRNYIQKSNLLSYTPYNTTPTWDESTKTISTTMTTVGNSLFTLSISGYIPSDGTYTLSGIFKRNGIPVTNSIWTNMLASVNGTLIRFYLNDTTGYFEITQTRTTGDNWIMQTYIPTGTAIGDVLSFTNLKFEKGTKATDWTPAIEDTQMLITNGTTATRPTATYIGQSHFDTTLGKPIWWNGIVWKDAMGTTV